MKYFLIHKKTKQVKSMSNSNIEYDDNIFELQELSWTKTEKDEWDKSDVMYYKNGELEFEYKNEITQEEYKKTKQKELKDKLNKAKSVNELKEIIINNLI